MTDNNFKDIPGTICIDGNHIEFEALGTMIKNFACIHELLATKDLVLIVRPSFVRTGKRVQKEHLIAMKKVIEWAIDGWAEDFTDGSNEPMIIRKQDADVISNM